MMCPCFPCFLYLSAGWNDGECPNTQLPTTLLAEVYTTPSAPQNLGALRPTYGTCISSTSWLVSLVSLQEKSTTCCGQEVANKNVICNYCKSNGAEYNKYNYWPWNSSMQINPIESQRRGSATWHFEHYVQTAVPPTDHHIYTDFSMATFILSPQ